MGIVELSLLSAGFVNGSSVAKTLVFALVVVGQMFRIFQLLFLCVSSTTPLLVHFAYFSHCATGRKCTRSTRLPCVVVVVQLISRGQRWDRQCILCSVSRQSNLCGHLSW